MLTSLLKKVIYLNSIVSSLNERFLKKMNEKFIKNYNINRKLQYQQNRDNQNFG